MNGCPLFSSVVDLMGMVVAQVQPSLPAADLAVADAQPVSLTSGKGWMPHRQLRRRAMRRNDD
ncbi:MAG: hypothetical protein MUF34_36620 [Polyangiaceae bacterium]|nr:hypothetical protein [Polyangiaceae bacterium]